MIVNRSYSLFTLLISLFSLELSLYFMITIFKASNSSMTSKTAKSTRKRNPPKDMPLLSATSSSEPILRDTTQLFSPNPLDYDEFVRVMIEFISHHPIIVPLTKTPNSFCYIAKITIIFFVFNLIETIVFKSKPYQS